MNKQVNGNPVIYQPVLRECNYLLPAEYVSVIMNYETVCRQIGLYNDFFYCVAAVKDALGNENASTEFYDKIEDLCLEAMSLFCIFNEKQQEVLDDLSNSIFAIEESAEYISKYLMLSDVFRSYKRGDVSDLINIVNCAHQIIDIRSRVMPPVCHKATNAFLFECWNFMDRLQNDNNVDAIAKSTVAMLVGRLSKNTQFAKEAELEKIMDSIGFFLPEKERNLFAQIARVTVFELKRKEFRKLFTKDPSSVDMVNHLVSFLGGTLECVLRDELDIDTTDSYLSELQYYESRLTNNQESPYAKRQLMILKYTKTAIIQDPYPLGIEEGTDPVACKETLDRIINEAATIGMEQQEQQIMYALLAAIALSNADQVEDYDDFDTDEFQAIVQALTSQARTLIDRISLWPDLKAALLQKLDLFKFLTI